MDAPTLSSTRWMLIIASLVVVSLTSLVGMVALAFKRERLDAMLPYLVSLAAGALLGVAGAHLLPEALSELGTNGHLPGLLLAGFAGLFLFEKLMHIVARRWPVLDIDHHHADCERAELPATREQKTLRINLLFGGGVHSLIDGTAIAIAYTASTSAGIATTVAVLLHEVPHHIGDMGVLLFTGLSPRKAILFKLLATSASLLGAAIMFFPGPQGRSIAADLLPITAASFIYIALSNLMPELRKEQSVSRSIGQVLAFGGGIALLYALNSLSES